MEKERRTGAPQPQWLRLCGLVSGLPDGHSSTSPEQGRVTPSVASESPCLDQGLLPTIDPGFRLIQAPIGDVLFLLAVTPSPASRREPAHSCWQLLERGEALFATVHINNVCSW